MVRKATGPLVLIADSRRSAAWVERSGHAPALVVHSNDDVPGANAAAMLALPTESRAQAPMRRDGYTARGVGVSVAVHLALAGALFAMVPGAPEAPPLMPVEMIFAEVVSDAQVKDDGKPAPVQPAELPVTEKPAPPPPEFAKVEPEPSPPPPEPEAPPPPVVERIAEPEPPPPVAEKEPEPLPLLEPEPLLQQVEEPPPPPPPPPIKAEKPPQLPKPKSRPRLVKPAETPPPPVPVVAAPSEPPREEAPPAKADAGQAHEAPQAAAPEIRQDKIPQEAAASVPSAAPIVNSVKMRNSTPPAYPARAREMNIEGLVVVEVWIDTHGNPTDVRVVQSSGVPALDDAARRGAWRWTFWPTTIDGRPTAARAHVPVPFKLN